MNEESRRKKIAYNNELNRQTRDNILIQPRKDAELPRKIAEAIAAGKAASRTEYIVTAILEKLERDGIE